MIKYSYARFLIMVMGIHGKRHLKSRHVSVQRLLGMGIGC